MNYTLYVCDECEDICLSSEPDMHECTRKCFYPLCDTVRRATSGLSDMLDLAVESHKATMEDLAPEEMAEFAEDHAVDVAMDKEAYQ